MEIQPEALNIIDQSFEVKIEAKETAIITVPIIAETKVVDPPNKNPTD